MNKKTYFKIAKRYDKIVINKARYKAYRKLSLLTIKILNSEKIKTPYIDSKINLAWVEYIRMILNKIAIISLHNLALSKRNNNLKILDLGCGTGLSSLEFLKKDYQVTGIDFSKEMLKKARKLPFNRLIYQDLEEQLNVKDNSFDAAVLIGVSGVINNPLKLFSQVFDKLKKEGIFSLTIIKKLPNSSKLDFTSYYPEEIESIFKKAGFKTIFHEEFFGYIINNEKVMLYGYVLRKSNKKDLITNRRLHIK